MTRVWQASRLTVHFLDHLEIAPDNNGSQRALRPTAAYSKVRSFPLNLGRRLLRRRSSLVCWWTYVEFGGISDKA